MEGLLPERRNAHSAECVAGRRGVSGKTDSTLSRKDRFANVLVLAPSLRQREKAFLI
jgi:hypothetical protein